MAGSNFETEGNNPSGFISNRLLKYLIAMSLAVTAATGLSEEENSPTVEAVSEDGKIMNRVQLVGVIADGSIPNAGIAVIKDSVTGRSYALRTGESLPGVAHIVLTDVKRDSLEFTAIDQKYVVRPFINTDSKDESQSLAQKTEETEDRVGESADQGPGLFEMMTNGQISDREPNSISLEAIKELQKKYENLTKESSERAPMRAEGRPSDSGRIETNPASNSDGQDGVIYENDEDSEEEF